MKSKLSGTLSLDFNSLNKASDFWRPNLPIKKFRTKVTSFGSTIPSALISKEASFSKSSSRMSTSVLLSMISFTKKNDAIAPIKSPTNQPGITARNFKYL